jgi:hypothetical protein
MSNRSRARQVGRASSRGGQEEHRPGLHRDRQRYQHPGEHDARRGSTPQGEERTDREQQAQRLHLPVHGADEDRDRGARVLERAQTGLLRTGQQVDEAGDTQIEGDRQHARDPEPGQAGALLAATMPASRKP